LKCRHPKPLPPLTQATSLKAQDQTPTKGLDSKLEPGANWTQLEFWDDEGTSPYLKECEGRDLLKDKAVLITGGDSGIGRSVAILMGREGADISFVYLPEEEEDAQYTEKEIEKAGRKAHLMALDITSRENCQKAVDEHIKVFGRINVLVNNSAMQEVYEDVKNIDLDVVEKTFRTNTLSMFAITKYAPKHMKRGSSIINSCSSAGYM
jgi:NAD(P)-dependent dehydrogenase (short-subunit alcohol dehydrogenase family)